MNLVSFTSKLQEEKTLYPVLFLVVLANVAIAVLYLFFKPLDPDEFQHTHIVWNMYFNHKVIYRDFWEHHGVTLPFVNFILFTILNLKANFDTFFVLRGASLLFMMLIGTATYLLAHMLFKSMLTALLSVAALSSSFFFLLKGIEIRPDVIQNVFWMFGLYFLIANLKSIKSNGALYAGIFFGLSILSNTKAGFCVAVVLIFFGLEFLTKLLMQRQETKDSLMRILKILAGIIIPHIAVLFYFLLNGAVWDFFEGNYLFNFIAATRDTQPYMLFFYWKMFLSYQLPVVIFGAVGIILLCWHTAQKRDFQMACFTFVTIGCVASIFLGLYSQFYLIFLPLIAISSAYAIVYAYTELNANAYLKIVGVSVLLLIYFCPLESFLVASVQDITLGGNRSNLKDTVFNATIQTQKDNTNFMLTHTLRSESVGYFWNLCGGYVFNQDVQYYWSFNQYHGSTYEVLLGKDAYGPDFIKNLEGKKVRYISAMQYELGLLFDQRTKEYILENYSYVNDCFLQHK